MDRQGTMEKENKTLGKSENIDPLYINNNDNNKDNNNNNNNNYYYYYYYYYHHHHHHRECWGGVSPCECNSGAL